MKQFIALCASVLFSLSLVLVSGEPVRATDTAESKEIVIKARMTVDHFMEDKNLQWFHENLKQAKAVLIIPQVLKAGFFWGGSGGTGVLIAHDEKTGEWSSPAFYTVGSVTYGLQIGAEESEVILLAMSQKAVDTLLASSPKLGGDISVAGGPHGVGINKTVTADFVSFARAKGLYAGLNLEGSVVGVREDLNKAYYGRSVRPVEILVVRSVSNDHAEDLVAALRKAAGK